jgi:hypothetical protein
VEYFKSDEATRRRSDAGAKTQYCGEIEVSYRESVIRCDGKTFPFPALSPVAQELVVAGGAEAVVARRLHQRA